MDLTNLDPNARISQYFTFKEALWLPRWNRMANPSDGLTQDVINNLVTIFKIMDKVREFIGKPIHVHCAYRPEAYNKLVGGSKASAHMCLNGLAAVDWSVKGIPCETIRQQLIPKLEEFGIRLENNGPDGNWLHVDLRKPGPGGRYFKP